MSYRLNTYNRERSVTSAVLPVFRVVESVSYTLSKEVPLPPRSPYRIPRSLVDRRTVEVFTPNRDQGTLTISYGTDKLVF